MSTADTRGAVKRSQLLVVGQAPGARLAIAEAIEQIRPEAHRIETLSPDALAETGRWVDAAAAIVLLSAEDHAEDYARWVALKDLTCSGRVLIVVPRGIRPVTADLLIGTLEPRAVVDDPVSRYALASALDRTVPAEERRSSRNQQRSSEGLLGISRAMQEISDQVRQIAPTRISVLILGETGTGKEVVARAIHRESPRSQQAFVAINCGAYPENLLASELFGSERGAFTGAERTRAGVFEQADGGTLFLDEVGEMSESMQVKLLRALEDGQIRRLGATSACEVDVRIVSATHRDLEQDVADGRFRQDLFFRLNTSSIYLPPLRRRAVDIPFLAQHFAEEFGAENARDITLSEDFLQALCEHAFPGNIRELRNTVERAIAITEPGDSIEREQLPSSFREQPAWQGSGTLKERVDQLEAQVIRETLAKHGGNRTHTAEALGLSRAGLRQKLRRLGID